MRNVIFYIPCLYTKHTRFKGIKGFITWTFKYCLLIFLISLIYWQEFNLIRFIFGLLLTYSLYEYGYIQNDAETIKKEYKPTKRLNEKELLFYEQHKTSIYFIRICFTTLFLILLILTNVRWIFLIYSFLIPIVFILYNAIRNKWNLYLHIILMFLRLSTPIFIACNHSDIILCIWILFVYPITVFIELSVKGKFGYHNKFFQKYILCKYEKSYFHIFRVKYYTIFTLAVLLFVLSKIIPTIYLLPTFYYYTLIIISALKNK